eukprot:CAMPEP_0197900962 /NCGR_PEP_ID=MMETSP1439-20131203/50376_1 /TAXON_ID=66791 /ORGANISM="Gonyaulax spinifera, Strain CCMP409" /LENGTH=140 /DNA_ID=CAMNT_0043521905 /DNA_START=47 /DNA_END=469 /DNA_ORIENTATION=+
MACAAPEDATHQGVKEMDPAAGFLAFVRGCPHVMASVKAFVQQNAPAFSQLGETDEHKLEYTEIHRRYVELLEGHVHSFVQVQGCTEQELMASIEACKDRGDEEWKYFRTLLNRVDYYTFAKMMQVEANGVGPRGPPPAS